MEILWHLCLIYLFYRVLFSLDLSGEIFFLAGVALLLHSFPFNLQTNPQKIAE